MAHEPGGSLTASHRVCQGGRTGNHRQWHDWKLSEGLLSNDPTSATQFLVDGKALNWDTGETPLLAKTLEHADQEGGIYQAGHKTSFPFENLGGLHTLKDFENYTGKYVTPISTNYRGYDVYECPLTARGSSRWRLYLSGFNMRDRRCPVDRLHLEIEAIRLPIVPQYRAGRSRFRRHSG